MSFNLSIVKYAKPYIKQLNLPNLCFIHNVD